MSAGKIRRSSVKEMGRSGIQAYFKEQVAEAGGMAEHYTSPGRKGVPDFLVTWPEVGFARLHLVECKTIGGRLEPEQIRDHERRRRMNCHVFVIWTKTQVDEYVARFRPR